MAKFYDPITWDRTWAPVDPLVTPANWEAELARASVKKNEGIPQERRRWTPQKKYDLLREKALDEGWTFAQYKKAAMQLSKESRGFLRAQVQYKRQLRLMRTVEQFADANRFQQAGSIERLVERAVCCEVRPKQTPYWWKPRGPFPKKERVAKQSRSWIADLSAERLEKKIRLGRIDWRLMRASRRQRMHTLVRVENHQVVKLDLTPYQREALTLGWLERDYIMSNGFKIRDALMDKVPGWRAFVEAQSYIDVDDEPYYAEMDSDAHGESSLGIEKFGNVVLEDNREKSYATPFPPSSDIYSSFSASQVPGTEYSLDRYFTFTTFEWNSTHLQGHELFSEVLPRRLIESFEDLPNFKEFLQHVYWRGDMTVQVAVNSNLRQYGQLQARFYYGSENEADFDTFKSNIFTGSQQPHCLISANTSNLGELSIPFEYIRPYLFVAKKDTTSLGDRAALGRLVILVVVPLTMAEGTEKSCRVSLRIKFSNNSFSGQVTRGMVGEGPLQNFITSGLKFLNMDKPTKIEEGLVILPQNTGSWSAGTGCAEWSVPLRLDPRGTLPYGPGRIPALDEMSIKHVVSIYGMVKILSWTKDLHSGSELWQFDATPTWAFDEYPKLNIRGRDCFILPPVSVVSNLFAFWRGSLKLRMDIVGAADLSGRLIVAYLPRWKKGQTIPSIPMLTGFAHSVFDLQENRQFEFVVPYLTDRMFWHRRHSMDRNSLYYKPPGTVIIAVYNDLIANSTIPSDCKIVCYLAAGTDFEVSVPSVPTIGLSYNTTILLSDGTDMSVHFKSGYYPTYVGSWRTFGDGKRCIMRYGEVTDHIAQMTGTSQSLVALQGKVLAPVSSFYAPLNWLSASGIIYDYAKYFVLWSNDAKNYWYLIPFPDKSQAQGFAANYNSPTASEFAMPFGTTSAEWNSPPQMSFVPTDLQDSSFTDTDTPFYAEMDERSSGSISISPEVEPSTTGAGQQIMGESFGDLKDYCRRFQKYAEGKIVIDPQDERNFKAVQLRFPAMPQGLDLDLGNLTDIREYWNRMRDGPIPIIASGYKFFTGGLRFRVYINTFDEGGAILPARILVQHRPGFVGPIPLVVPTNYAWLATSDLEMPGFAYHVQNELMNNIVSIEVPYYLPSIRGYLQRPLRGAGSSLKHSLGEIVISVETLNVKKFNFSYIIYYSLADDSRFSLFQGFPPVFPITNIPDIRSGGTRRNRRDIPASLPPVPEDREREEEVDAIPFITWEDVASLTTYPKLLMECEKAGVIKEFRDIGKSKQDLIHYMRQLTKSVFVDNFYRTACNIAEDKQNCWQNKENIVKHFKLNKFYDDFTGLFKFFAQMDEEPQPSTSGGLFSNISKSIENLASIDIESINAAFTSVNSVAETVKDAVDDTRSVFSDLNPFREEDAETQTDSPPKNLENFMNHIMSIILNATSFMLTPTVANFVISVSNVLINLKLISAKFISSIGSKLSELVKWLLGSNEQDEDYVGQAEDDSALAGYISTLIAGVAGTLNLAHSLCRDKKRSIAKILLHDIKDFSLTSNHLFTFCKNNIEAIKTCMESLWREKPIIKELAFFEDYDDQIFQWAKDVLTLTDGRNKEIITGNMVMANKVYDCANMASLIQLKLMTANKEKPLEKSKLDVITKLIRDIHQLRDHLARLHIAPCVKFEPYVIHFHGATKLGKSFIAQELPFELLKTIKYKSYNEIVYVRTAGNPWWNNLSHQPVVIFDDFYQISSPEFGGLQLAELFQLKTRAVFNPPMAAVEDKSIRYNPLIVILCSNNPFPKYEHVQSQQAVDRRIDMLVHVQKTARYRHVDVSRIPRDVLARYDHLEFYVHKNVTDRTERSSIHSCWSEFLGQCCSSFLAYYRNELQNYNKAMRRVSSLYPEDESEIFKLPNSQFWTSTQEYLQYVNKEDHEFNLRYSQSLKDYVSHKIRTMAEVLANTFEYPYYKANADDGDEYEVYPEDDFVSFEADGTSSMAETCIHQFLIDAVAQGLAEYNDNLWALKLDLISLDWQKIDIFLGDRDISLPIQVAFLNKILVEDGKLETLDIELIPLFVYLQVQNIAGRSYYTWRNRTIIYCPEEDYLMMPHEACAHPSCCFSTKIKRNRLIGEYIAGNSYLSRCVEIGENISEFVPREYLLSLTGVEASTTKIDWLKGFFKKVYSKFTLPHVCTLYRWVVRVLWMMVVLSPICMAVLLVKGLTNSKENFEKTADKMMMSSDFQRELAAEIIRSRPYQPQGFVSGDSRVKGTTKPTPKQFAQRVLGPQSFQAQMSQQEMEFLDRSILRNTFFLAMEREAGFVFGRGLGVFGHNAIIPTHYLDLFKELAPAPIYFIPALRPVAIRLESGEVFDKIIDYSNSSLSVVNLPVKIPLFKDIESKFTPETMIQHYNHVSVIVEVTSPSSAKESCQLNKHYVETEDFDAITTVASGSLKSFTVSSGFRYRHFSGPGRCGSLLVATNLPQGILGMHVAGSHTYGVSEIITREMIQQIRTSFGNAPDPVEPPYLANGGFLDAQVIGLGRVEPKFVHRESEKSRIVPSIVQIYGDFPVYTDVAVLSPKDKRLEIPFSPMAVGCQYHGQPLLPFDDTDLKVVFRCLQDQYLAKCIPTRGEVGKLTKLQACRGFEGCAGYESLEWRTSEGFPFVADRPWNAHNKRWLFSFDDNGRCIGLDPKLRAVMKLKKAQRLSGEVPFTVFTDCLKDTTVSLEKVLVPGKTRIFSMSPVDFTITQRQLTLDFSVAMMANRFNLDHAVGINPDSVEWTWLAQRLLAKGGNIVTGDYSKFGDSIPFEIVDSFFKLINAWYSKFSRSNNIKDDLQRVVFAEEIGHAAHLMFDFVYKCLCGQPSGNSLTVLLNSYAGNVYLRLAWLSIMRQTEYCGLACYQQHVQAFTYGDDVILSVSDDVIERFNAGSLCRFFAEHQLKFTNANKSDDICLWQTIWEADFLKRGFVLHPVPSRRVLGIMLAPLEIPSIEDTINWVWNSGYDVCDLQSPDFVAMCVQVCEDASRNAWTRGPEYYHTFCRKLIDFWGDLGVHVVFASWEDLDRKVFDLNQDLNNYTGFERIAFRETKT